MRQLALLMGALALASCDSGSPSSAGSQDAVEVPEAEPADQEPRDPVVQVVPEAVPTAMPIPGPDLAEGWRAGQWSNTDAGLRARLLVGPSTEIHGTPVARIDLELENVSDVGTPMLIRWDESSLLSFSLTHDDGSDVATGMRNGSVRRPRPYEIALPYHASLRMDLSVRGWSIAPDHRVHVALPNRASWTVPTDESRPLQLSLVIDAPLDPDNPRAWRGKLEVPAIEVATQDSAADDGHADQ